MTDRSSPMACSPQKSEQTSPSLISPSSPTDHNHHGHPLKVPKGHEGDKTKVGCSKSYNVEEYNHDTEQLNGCLHIYSDTSVHNPNMLTCPKQAGGDDHDLCLHTSISNSLSTLNKPKSCLEKVNGLTHTVAEHSSCDSRLIVNLLNNSTSETEELQSSINCNVVSNQGSEKVHHVRKGLASYDEVETVNGRESSYEVPCNSEHCDCLEGLATKLGKTSLHEHSNSSELLTTASTDVNNGVAYVVYESEKQMPDIMRLITKDLSEPYSIYTYRYFIHNWPKLCILAMVMDTCVGAIVCKLDLHKKMVRRGYIAMLAVDSEYRRRQIGSTLVTKAIEAMMRDDCDEVVLETEITNEGALRLYENLGFVRDKRLFRYYLNGVDALRLKLWLR